MKATECECRRLLGMARVFRGRRERRGVVFKRVCQIKDEATAFEAVAVMLQGRVVELTASLALDAARLSLDTGLAMVDSVILATARLEKATLWTQDAHFAGFPQVEFRAKP